MEKKAQAKTARFYLLPKSYNENLNEIGQEQQQGDRNKVPVNQDTNVNEKYYEFIRHFSGVSKYIDKKYTQLKQEESEKEKNETFERKQISIFSIIVSGVNALLFLLFFIFSLISIIFIKNPKRNYMEYSLLGGDEETVQDAEFISYLNDKLEYFTKDSQTKLMLVSKARISIYYRNEDNCNPQYSQELKSEKPTCYDAIFEKYKGNLPTFDDTNSCIGEDTEDANCDSMNFKSELEGVDNYKIKGNYGVYKGKDCLTTFINLFTLEDSVYDVIMNKIYEAKSKNKNQFLALAVSLTAYSFISETYYYTTHLLEFLQESEQFITKCDVIPFYPNLKEVKGGVAVFVLDIFRLIFIILIFLVVFKKLFDSTKGKGKNKPNSKLKDSSPSFIETLFSCILFIHSIFFNKSKKSL